MVRCYLCSLVAQVALLFAAGQCNPYTKGLEVLYEWTTPDFTWSSLAERHEAIKSERYIPTNVFIWDANAYYYHQSDRKSCAKAETIIFVTTPRQQSKGIPAVLSTVEMSDGRHNPRLKPFPNWEYNRQGNCDGLTNAVRLWLDKCNRLWVLDTGTVGAYSQGTQQRICQPKIHIFDNLESGGRLVGRFSVPDDVLVCESYLSWIILDYVHEHGSCDEVYAYLTDEIGNGIVVFLLQDKSFTRVVHNSFFPDPEYGDFSIAGVNFAFMSGVVGHSLSPNKDGHRTFYYRAFSSVKQSYVNTAVLRDQEAFRKNPRAYPYSFHTFPKRLLSQSAADCMNSDGIMFFNFLTQNALACWNSQRDPNYEQTPIVAQNDTTMQYISSLQVLDYQLYAVSSRAQILYTTGVSPHEINYRILYACVPELTRGTACESAEEQSRFHYSPERHYEDYDY